MKKLIVIGGGAAGFFAAINFAEKFPGSNVTILEKSSKVLSKVKVSGGGRCNVTNIISDPAELAKFYPRGSKELKSVFYKFSSNDIIEWFEQRKVKLKVEEDGRVFPVSDDSQTIVDCLISSADKAGVKILTKINIKNIIAPDLNYTGWRIETSEKTFSSDVLLIASGSNGHIWELLKNKGHKIEQPVPSLFTFNVKDSRIKELAGISLKNIKVSIEGSSLITNGDLLITHWGFSGPAILKLSAWGARELFTKNYKFNLIVNWVNLNTEKVKNYLLNYKVSYPNKNVLPNSLFNLPSRLWERIILSAEINPDLKWNDVSKILMNNLAQQLSTSKYSVNGKSTFKEEFVTCGGVNLKEVDFKTMQSKIHKGLFFAGEVLNIDAVTGGFNFQSAWTTAWVAANSIE